MNEPKGTALDGLKYAMSIVANRKVRKSTPDYMAALGEIEVFLQAAIERVENGEPMQSTAQTQ
jgi:hypothetical protein